MLTALPRCQERFLIDEHGNFVSCPLKSLVADLPLLVAMLLASLFLVIVSYGVLLSTKAILIFRPRMLRRVAKNEDRISKNG